MYKKAAMQKIRFEYRGILGVEDLFDLDLEQLDAIYQKLKKLESEAAGESLMKKRSAADTKLALQIALVKDVYETKEAALEARKAAAEKREKKARLMEILADKQDAALLELSEEELLAKIEEL